MLWSGYSVSRGGGEINALWQATHTHSPTIWIPEVAMGPDHPHIRSVDGGDRRCATSYGLQSSESSEKMKGSVASPGFPRMLQEAELQLMGDSGDGGGYAILPSDFHRMQQAGVWLSAQASDLGTEGGATWFPMDSAGGGGQTQQVDHNRDRGSRTGSAELGFGR